MPRRSGKSVKNELERLESFMAYLLAASHSDPAIAVRKMGRIMRLKPAGEAAIQWLASLGADGLHRMFVSSQPGAYRRLNVAVRAAAELDLTTCSLSEILAIPGVRDKTARMFWLHGRGQDAAIVDLAMLRWMRSMGAVIRAQGGVRRYADIENLAVSMLRAQFPGLSLQDADLLASSAHNNRLERG